MATLSSPPLVPLPLDASPPPTSHTPALTPSPVATQIPSTPASRPSPDPTAGRSKAQRWGQDTPPSGKSGGGAPPTSYKQALLAVSPVSSRSSAPPLPEVSPRAAPRFVLRAAVSRPPPQGQGAAEGGWTEVESRRARKERLRAARGPRRRVPADLRGLCFNCFAPNHRAAACKRPPRCFKCRRLGHRACWCPTPGMSRPAVWCRKETGLPVVDGGDGTAGLAAVPPPTGAVEVGDSPPDRVETVDGGEAQKPGRRRQRRRVRLRRVAGREGADRPPSEGSAPPPLASRVVMPGVEGAAATTLPRRIIDRSAKIAHAEEELQCALSVLLVGDPAAVSVEGLVAELARRHDLPASSMIPHRLNPNEVLVVCSTVEDVVRVYNDGRSFHLDSVAIHCRRWSRFKNATAVSLPHLIDVEVRGVPAHVWELETAEHLLDEWCWVRALRPDTLDRLDYSSFRVSAWCSNPEGIPASMELVVVEPPAPVAESPPVRRALAYTVQISVEPGDIREVVAGLPPAPLAGHDRRRRRGSRSPGTSPCSSSEGSPNRGGSPRPQYQDEPVRDGGGPGV
ncbi:unnamed protein product [Urochloa humidicola]